MEKIKIIELLQRVSNGTQPDEIFYNKSTYRWIEENNNYYRTASGSDYISFEYDNYIIDNLNDYVEILKEGKKEDDFSGIKFYQKEDNKIEKLYLNKSSDVWAGKTDIEIITDKINEIIEVLNERDIQRH